MVLPGGIAGALGTCLVAQSQGQALGQHLVDSVLEGCSTGEVSEREGVWYVYACVCLKSDHVWAYLAHASEAEAPPEFDVFLGKDAHHVDQVLQHHAVVQMTDGQLREEVRDTQLVKSEYKIRVIRVTVPAGVR